MSTLINMLRGGYHLLPETVRRRSPLQQTANRITLRFGDINDIYSSRYYQTLVEPYARNSVDPMARSIVDTFHPASVVDVGCGSGLLLVALRKLGVRNSLGLDASEAGLDVARARGLDTRKFDITTDQLLYSSYYDAAISTETAEHLPASSASRYIELLCSLAPIIIFTAAQPGQNGIGHLNEQPPAYWKDLFAAHHFQCLEKTAAEWKIDWEAAGIADFYTNNLMIFRR